MSKTKSSERQRAEKILQGKEHATPDEILKLSKDLKKELAFGLARRMLSRARRDPKVREDKQLLLEIVRQHALCTYKDPDLPARARLDCALQILGETGEDLADTCDQETLGIAGAIFKRKWELDGQRQHLERSLAYYRRGYEQGIATDYGYTAINAAFVLDILACEEQDEAKAAGAVSKSACVRREEAQGICREIAEVLPALLERPDKAWLAGTWWFLATLGEAYFGLGQYEDALFWLKRPCPGAEPADGVADWEYESTARQLVALARLQARASGTADETENSPAWAALRKFLGYDAEALRSASIGKVGLALSGGGFRASLFHIGVLARLAELDVLRSVEVLSCVSGGSIIGAHYYLEVRKLLQSKPDEQITRQDYIDIVKRIERDFLAGVQRNVRTRMLADWWANVRMIFQRNYSRTLRLGELYEEEIYSRVQDGHGNEPLWINELFVQPKGGPNDFSPRRDNWRRGAKVPILILNATPLNTGHNWQFTASWMGEPPTYIDIEADSNERLRRMYYDQAPDPHDKVRLGHAVAASSCVPGLFQPIALDGLYPDRTVQLVDGGVHDNQGIAGLLGEDCTVMLVSDASGQMESKSMPNVGIFDVPLRSNNILMARVREEEYEDLAARRRSGLLKGLMFVHLKKGLEVEPVDWIGCQDPYEAADDCRSQWPDAAPTDYGIPKEVQRKLADIRTDLDSFSDMEAYALMTSAYRMTEHELPRSVSGLPSAGTPSAWQFLSVESALSSETGSKDHKRLMKILDVACNLGFKVWKLVPALTALAWIAALGAIALMIWIAYEWWSVPLFRVTTGGIATAIALVVLVVIASKAIVRWTRFRKTWSEIAIGLGFACGGFLAALAHVWIFDRWYLRKGRVQPPQATPALGTRIAPPVG